MMLDRPQLADLVIPDLARWEDWSVTDRLVELFKKSNEESSWVRVPVINYLRACPLPDAKQKIDELAKIDPESIKRANSFFPLGTAAGATADAAKDKPTDGTKPAESEKAEADSEAKPPAGAAKGDAAPVEKKTSAPEKAEGKPTAAATIRLRPENQVSQAKPTAVLPGQLAPGAAIVPGPPAQSMPVVAGMAGAAFVLACAFWAILKGGQRTAA
jgi:hypothetical protein